MDEKMKQASDVMFEVGLKHRREVLGAEYVDGSLNAANDFMMAFQHITTEWCWGYGWSRDGLPRKTRSLLNLAIDKAHHQLGWAPRWNFATTVERTVSWYRRVQAGQAPAVECCLDDLAAYRGAQKA